MSSWVEYKGPLHEKAFFACRVKEVNARSYDVIASESLKKGNITSEDCSWDRREEEEVENGNERLIIACWAGSIVSNFGPLTAEASDERRCF